MTKVKYSVILDWAEKQCCKASADGDKLKNESDVALANSIVALFFCPVKDKPLCGD